MQLVQPTKRRPTSIGTFIVTTALAVLALIFFVWPKYKTFIEAQSLKQNNENSLQTVQQQQAAVNNLIKQIQANSSDLAKVDMAIPDQPNLPDVYALIELQAQQAGLSITSMQGRDETDASQPNGSNASTSADLSAFTDQSSGSGTGVQTPPPPSPTLGVLDIGVQVNGSLSNFGQFLTALQDNLRLIDVQSIDVSSDPDKPGLTFRVLLKTYYQKTP